MKNLPRSTFVKRLPALLLAASILCAAGTSAIAEVNPSILAVNRSVSLSYLRSSMYYIEPDSGQSGGYFDYEQGTLKGRRLALSYMGPQGFYLSAAGDRAKGTVGYHAFGSGNPPAPVEGNSRAATREFDLKIGKGFAFQDAQWLLTPYLAAGRRQWIRNILVGTPGEFTETYDFQYFGLGEMIQYAPSTRWVITGDAMIGKTVRPSVDVPPVLNHAALGSAPIIKLGLEADYQATTVLHLFAGYEYTYFTFGQSETQPSGFIEPNSETKLRSLAVGLRFSF